VFEWNKINRDKEGHIELLYRHQRIFDEGIVTTGSKVLDVGGWGILAQAINERGSECVILDNFSEDQYFPDRVKELEHIDGDILDTEQASKWGKYDVVTCFEMLEHCVDQPQAVKNIYNMLLDGGVLVGTFPLPGFCHDHGEEDITLLDKEALHSLLESAKFSDILIEDTASEKITGTHCSMYFKARKVESDE
jgi:SAM-dependent methyltransferase